MKNNYREVNNQKKQRINSKQKTVYLISQAGFGNLGDELILREWLKYIDNVYQGRILIYIDVVNVNFCRMMTALWGITSKVEFINICWSAALDIDDNSIIRELSYQSIIYKLLTIPKIDVLHILGGGYINDVYSKNIHLIPIAAIIKQITGCKLYATGISFYPLNSISKTAHRYFLRCLNDFELIDVRDGYSVEIFDGLSDGIIEVCDDLFLSENIDTIINVTNKENRRLSLMLQVGEAQNMVHSYVSEMIDFFMNKKIIEGVNFYCFDDGLEVFCRQLIASKPKIQYDIYSCFDLLVKPIEINQKDYYFCTKFHGHFLVSLAGIYGVCSATNKYYDNKHKSLIKMGSGFNMIGMHDNIIDEGLFKFSSEKTFRNKHADLHKLKLESALRIYQP